MFEQRELSGELAAVRERHAPEALVLETPEFETLPPERAEGLGLLVERMQPAEYDRGWLPADAPDQLRRYVESEFAVGLPGDGGVAWTAQTEPPCVFLKARLEGSPEPFREFLLAEALVQAGSGLPETFPGFFEERYRELADVGLGPADSYQLAAALYEAYLGLHTRPTFADWAEPFPGLHDAWVDAGERLVGRLEGLAREVATGSTSFAAAAELACSAVKHDVDVPTPFGALDTAAYRDAGPEYAVAWARKTVERMDDGNAEA